MESLEPLDQPPNWGRDELTNFLELAQRNAYASFVTLRAPFAKLLAIDAFYRRLIDNLNNPESWFAALFLLRAHSCFLAAARTALSGQLPETYLLLRGCLENALYGFYLARRPELREVWLRRHDDAASMRTVKIEFQIGTIITSVDASDAQAARVAKELYDRTIDYGAHPNERALTQVLGMDRGTDHVRFEVRYLTRGDELAFGVNLKTTAQVGVCVLDLFRLVYRERFDILGLTDQLANLKRDL